jgi:hypothetical protein
MQHCAVNPCEAGEKPQNLRSEALAKLAQSNMSLGKVTANTCPGIRVSKGFSCPPKLYPPISLTPSRIT